MGKSSKALDSYIQKQIKSFQFRKMGLKTTVCLIRLTNGFEVVGTSAGIRPEDYNEREGQKFSYENAIHKIYELEAYRLHDEIYKNGAEIFQFSQAWNFLDRGIIVISIVTGNEYELTDDKVLFCNGLLTDNIEIEEMMGTWKRKGE